MHPGDFLTVQELLRVLGERGLKITDSRKAAHYLETVGHHRLSSFYAEFFDSSSTGKKFDLSTLVDMEDVVKLYLFDRRLRLLLMGPLEKIEVALRALIVAEVGNFLHTSHPSDAIKINLFDKSLYKLEGSKVFGRERKILFDGMLQRISSDTSRRKSQTARIERGASAGKGDENSESAAWHTLQAASFGPIVHLFSLLRPEIAVPIAKKFRIHREVLSTILFALIDLRNACAHHDPIWNWPVRPRRTLMEFPRRFVSSAQIVENNERRLYAYCAVIHILLSFLSDGKTTWYRRFKKLINEFDTLYSSRMGLPENWQTLAFWCVQDVERLDSHVALRTRLSEQKKGPP